MHLDHRQRGVVLGMASGLVVSVIVVGFGARWFVMPDTSERFGISLLLPALALLVAIARLASHRFLTPADIDGSALGVGTERAKLLQVLLQNTLEQVALAFPVYVAALSSSNPIIRDTAPACAFAFLAGRLLFFITYKRGAQARAFGFVLTFYPTVLLLVWQLWFYARAFAGL